MKIQWYSQGDYKEQSGNLTELLVISKALFKDGKHWVQFGPFSYIERELTNKPNARTKNV